MMREPPAPRGRMVPETVHYRLSIVPKTRSSGPALGSADYTRLASFRYALRSFLYFSEAAAERVGLTSQQYQALLVVRSLSGTAPVSIADLAEQLLIKHNSAVGLADRLVAQSLMVRERVPDNRRKVQLRLTRKGETVVGKLAAIHRRKLRRIGPQITRALEELAGAWRES
jgi:DNA-binding MarR family transcriptional regulator